MVKEGNYDAVALITAGAGKDEYHEPSVSLSLANVEAAIRARVEYVKNLPDNLFDQLTKLFDQKRTSDTELTALYRVFFV